MKSKEQIAAEDYALNEENINMYKMSTAQIAEKAFLAGTNSGKKEIIEYCKPHLDKMWAATIVSMLLNCDFRDSYQEVEKYEKI